MTHLNTDVPGKPDDVRAAAELLNPSFHDSVDYSEDVSITSRNRAQSQWRGEAEQAYLSIVGDMQTASNDLKRLASDAGEKLHAYAGQLTRIQRDFANYRQKALNAGIIVEGTRIIEPVNAVGYVVESRDDPNWDAYREYVRKYREYDDIAEDIGRWIGEISAWIDTNLREFYAGIPTDGGMFEVFNGLDQATEISRTYLDAQSESWELYAREPKAQADATNAEITRWAFHATYGNETAKAEANKHNPEAMRADANEVRAYANRTGKVATFIPGVGWVLDGVEFYQSLENGGESPSSTGVGILVGAAGGALGGKLVVVLGLTSSWGPIGVVVGAGILIGYAAEKAWEHWVPQETREAIDDGVRRGWNATTDFAENAWTTTKETTGDIWYEIWN